MRPQQALQVTNSGDQIVSSEDASQPRWRMPYAKSPRYIQLETVTVCNAKCPFCPQNEIKREPPRMPDKIWRKIVDETRGLGITYRPFLTNEPFVDKRQLEIVRYIKENDPTARVVFILSTLVLATLIGAAPNSHGG